MKSAYELAMERLSKSAPAKSLTASQKAALAEIESLAKSRIAQLEMRSQDDLAAAQAAGDAEKIELIRHQFLREKAQIEADRETKKEGVRCR